MRTHSILAVDPPLATCKLNHRGEALFPARSDTTGRLLTYPGAWDKNVIPIGLADSMETRAVVRVFERPPIVGDVDIHEPDRTGNATDWPICLMMSYGRLSVRATTDIKVGEMTCALAVPEGKGPFPGVVVVHEAFGLNRDIRRIAGRFADNGYVALAPDLFARGRLCMLRMIVGGLQDQALADIEQARIALSDRAETDGSRIGVIGFCMGGGFALLFAARGGVKVASVNYGKVPKERQELAGVCPIVGSYGGRDRVFLKDAQRLEAHLAALRVEKDIKIYDGVGHSFISYDNAPAWMARIPTPIHLGYSEPEAEDAWRRILAFFERYLVPAEEL